MKKIVIYRSKTGFTKKYAEWISNELSCDLCDCKKVNQTVLETYDVIIYGAGIMAGQIKGFKQLKESLASIPSKKLVVFATGATKMDDEKALTAIRQANFPDGDNTPYFYFTGGLNYEKMGFFGRSMMKMMSSAMAKKKDATEEEKAEAKAMSQSSDYSDKEYIKPLVEYVSKM